MTRDGAYWAANLRNPVRFAAAVSAALADGYRAFVEIAPHPVVSYSVNEVLTAERVDDAVVAHTLRRNRPEQATLLANLATLHCHGVPVDWSAGNSGGRLVSLPVIAWQHREHKVARPAREQSRTKLHDVDTHTLLGSRLTVNGTSTVRVWQTWLDQASRPYPGDHPVQGTEIIPAAVLLNTFFAAAAGHVLTDVSLRVPVSVASPRELQVVAMDGTLRLCSRLPDTDGEPDGDHDSGWLTHTTAIVPAVAEVAGADTIPVAELRNRCGERLDSEFVIDRLASIGVAAMGFPWQINRIRRGADELFVRVVADPDGTLPQTWASILDAALSAASVVFAGQATLRMPAHIRRVAIGGRPPADAVISVRVQRGSADTVDVTVATPEGDVVARLDGLRYGVLDGDVGAPASPRRLVHKVDWRPLELPRRARGGLPRVVFVGDAALAAELGASLAESGVDWLAVAGPEELDGVRDKLTPTTAVLVAPPRTDEVWPGAVAATWLVTRTARTLAAARSRSKLWCVTRGVREAGQAEAVAESALWGVGRVLAGEYPEIWGGLLDLPGDDPLAGIAVLRKVLTARPTDDVIAVRAGGAEVARLSIVDGAPTARPVVCRPDGTYLITGGLGVLGLEVAGWLAGRGARRLVLAGRHALPPRAEWDTVTDTGTVRRIEAVRALEAAGVTVVTLALDIGDPAQAARLASIGDLGLPQIRGVVHAAGVLDNRLAADVDEASLETVMRPKVAGAQVLHELFPPGSVDFFALFSSAGLLLGLPGQASYAAGNAVLDALATHRRAGGHRDTISLGWTSWRGLGMSTSSQAIDAELSARGTADITAAEAFRSWEYAERHDVAHVAVLRTIPLLPGMKRPPLLSELTADEPVAAVSASAAPWAGLRDEELREYLLGEVSGQVAAEMKLAVDELDTRRPLIEMGFDSVMTQMIRARLERRFRVSLPATLLWNRPTVQAISDFVAELLGTDQSTWTPRTRAPTRGRCRRPRSRPDRFDPFEEVEGVKRDGVTPWPPEFARRYAAQGHWRGRPLGHWMWAWADRYGDRVAVVDGDRAVRYRELAEHADALADHLHDLGLRDGDNILVQLPNTWEFLALFLACQRIGVAPVLALLAHREHELRYLAELAEVKAIVVPDQWQRFDHRTMAVDLAASTCRSRARSSSSATRTTTSPPWTCARCWRSGRTRSGCARGSTPTRPAVARSRCSCCPAAPPAPRRSSPARTTTTSTTPGSSGAVCEFGEDTVYLVTLPVGHNFPLGSPGILATLIHGGRVVMLRSPKPEVAFPLIERERVTVTSLVPAIAQRWVEAAPGSGHDLSQPAARAGRRLGARPRVRRADRPGARRHAAAGLRDGRGPAELHPPRRPGRGDQPHAGPAHLPGRRGPLVDERARTVPPGGTGELLTRGPYTPRGYFRAPEHNARAFTAGRLVPQR